MLSYDPILGEHTHIEAPGAYVWPFHEREQATGGFRCARKTPFFEGAQATGGYRCSRMTRSSRSTHTRTSRLQVLTCDPFVKENTPLEAPDALVGPFFEGPQATGGE